MFWPLLCLNRDTGYRYLGGWGGGVRYLLVESKEVIK